MRNEPDSLDVRSLSALLIVILSRDRTWYGRTNVRPALRSNLFFYSHLRSAWSRSLVYGTGRSNSPRGLSIHLRERASERWRSPSTGFSSKMRPCIKSREPRRGGRRAAATDPEAAATGWSAERPRPPPLVRRTIRLRTLYTNRSTSCFTTAREIGPCGVCDAIASAGSSRLIVPRFFQNIVDERKGRFSQPLISERSVAKVHVIYRDSSLVESLNKLYF